MANTLTVIDNRSGKKLELPIEHGAIRAVELGRLGIVSYDPALLNTAACKSKISFIDGDRGILRYRGYPIEELAERSTFLETAYLIVKGELPTTSHFRMWQHNIKTHTLVHENLKHFIEGFRYDAHPMGILIGTVGALSTFYPEARHVMDLESRRMQTRRLIGKMPTIAAFAYRHSRGLPYVYPDNDLSYTGNFLSMMFKMTELKYKPDPVLEHALDVLFILHADHEQNCSTTTMRTIGSALADPYVDFYSGIIYEAMQLPVAMFPVLFAIARTAGWMAQWAELVLDEEQKITRPKQIYVGYDERSYVPLDQRRDGGALEPEVSGPL